MKNRKRGFTLIELLVVVLIIGILAAVALPQYTKAVTKSRFAEAMTNLKTIHEAKQVCLLSTGKDNDCGISNLDISIGKKSSFSGCLDSYETENFYYCASGTSDTIPSAQYKKEDVCVCYKDDGQMILDYSDCIGNTTIDFSKLLNIPEDHSSCGCC